MNNTLLRFSSLAEFADYCEHSTIKAVGDLSTTSNTGQRLANNNGATFKDAVKLAYDGWLDGASKISAMSAPLISRLTSMIDRYDINYDVEGTQIDVARFVDGEPQCWQTWDVRTVEGLAVKHLEIVYNASAASSVNASSMTQRGAAIAALIEALEYAGHRVKLTTVFKSRGTNKVSTSTHTIEVRVTVKSNDQPLDMPHVAFAILHPAYSRRLFLRAMECQSDWNQLRVSAGYGWPTDTDERGDLYLGAMEKREQYQWNDSAYVQNWIIETLKAQGVHLHEN